MQRQDHNPTQRIPRTPIRPLPQILNQKERIEDIHPSSGLIQHHHIRIEQ